VESRIIVSGAQVGLLYEILALIVVMSRQPHPIANHFGDTIRNEENIQYYYGEVSIKDYFSVALANLSAFMYWDYIWYNEFRKIAFESYAQIT